MYWLACRALSRLRASVLVVRLLLAVERRALRLLISAIRAADWVVGEDILMRVAEGGVEEGFVTDERWVGLSLGFWCVVED